MAYAELWAPIQNATNSLNQTINNVADREARRAGQGLQNLMAADQMAGNQFSREMSAASNARQERQLEMEAGALSERQKLDKAQEARQAATFALQKPGLEAEAARQKALLAPRDVNIYDYVPKNSISTEMIFKDTDAAKRAASIFGGENAAFDPKTGQLYNTVTKERIRPTGLQLGTALPSFMGVLAAYGDPQVARSKEISALESEYEAADEAVRKYSKDKHGRFIKQAAEASARKDKLGRQLDRLTKSKPWDLIDQYANKQKILEQTSMQAAANGANPQVIAVLNNAYKENSDILQKLHTAKYDYLTGGSDGKPVMKTVHQLDSNGNPIETQIMAVPKLAKGMLPQDVDPTLQKSEGWVWGEDLAAHQGNKEASGAWVAGHKLAQTPFGKEGPEGQFILTPRLMDQGMAASRRFEQRYAETKDPIFAGNAARDDVLRGEQMYWNKFNEMMNQNNYDLSNTDGVAAVEATLRQSPYGLKYYEMFGYYPKIDNHPALQ